MQPLDMPSFAAMRAAGSPSALARMLPHKAYWPDGSTTGTCMQVGFMADDVSAIIKESVDSVLMNQVYNEQMVRALSTQPA